MLTNKLEYYTTMDFPQVISLLSLVVYLSRQSRQPGGTTRTFCPGPHSVRGPIGSNAYKILRSHTLIIITQRSRAPISSMLWQKLPVTRIYSYTLQHSPIINFRHVYQALIYIPMWLIMDHCYSTNY